MWLKSFKFIYIGILLNLCVLYGVNGGKSGGSSRGGGGSRGGGSPSRGGGGSHSTSHGKYGGGTSHGSGSTSYGQRQPSSNSGGSSYVPKRTVTSAPHINTHINTNQHNPYNPYGSATAPKIDTHTNIHSGGSAPHYGFKDPHTNTHNRNPPPTTRPQSWTTPRHTVHHQQPTVRPNYGVHQYPNNPGSPPVVHHPQVNGGRSPSGVQYNIPPNHPPSQPVYVNYHQPIQHTRPYNPNVHVYVHHPPTYYRYNDNYQMNNLANAIHGYQIYHTINRHDNWYRQRQYDRNQYYASHHNHNTVNVQNKQNYVPLHNNTVNNSLAKLAAVEPFDKNKSIKDKHELTNKVMSDVERKYNNDVQHPEIVKAAYSSLYLVNLLNPKNSEILNLPKKTELSDSSVSHMLPKPSNHSSNYDLSKLNNPSLNGNETIVKNSPEPIVLPLTLHELPPDEKIPEKEPHSKIKHNSGDMIQVTNTLLFSILALFLIN